jgi:hypothetical protein
MAIWNVYIDEAGDEGFKIVPTFVAGRARHDGSLSPLSSSPLRLIDKSLLR